LNQFDQSVHPKPNGNPSLGEAESHPLFTPRPGTYILLFFLVVIWPTAGLLFLLFGEVSFDWELYDPVYTIFLPTIIVQWPIFLVVALGLCWENSDFWSIKFQRLRLRGVFQAIIELITSSFRSIGFIRFRFRDIFYAIAFLIISNLILSGLQLFLSLFDLSISQDVNKLVEKASESTWWWLAVSVTAAVCEETAFRGYIMTRVKGVFRKSSWALPVVLSSFAFAAGHSYQGVGGLILLFVYGLMFCGLYLSTRSIWPCIIAHFIQDFSAIFLYKYVDF
jgi:membrane protease YdiL (CAAX protease family)